MLEYESGGTRVESPARVGGVTVHSEETPMRSNSTASRLFNPSATIL
jgi:hypothetical protein